MNTSLLNRFTLIQRFSPSGCKKGLWKKKYSQITNRLTKDKYLPLSPGDICRHWCGSTCPQPPRTGSAFISWCRWQQGTGAIPCPGLGAASGLGTGPGRASRRVRSSLSQKNMSWARFWPWRARCWRHGPRAAPTARSQWL